MDEEKLEELKKLVIGNYNCLYTDYDDGEYRMLYYKLVNDLIKILDI